MKNVLLVGFIFLVLTSCKNVTGNDTAKATQAATDSANFTTVQFPDALQNLGTLKMGEKASIKFHFKNTGNKPLFILSATPGCGCTVADFPKEAIAAGSDGVIVAEFDTNKSHEGHFSKSIIVATNTKETTSHTLNFDGDIIKEADDNSKSSPHVDTTTTHKN